MTSLEPSRPMNSIKTLRLSQNELTTLDLASFPRTRILYADENKLRTLDRTDGGKGKLEALSLRNQRINGFRLPASETAGVKRLYVSGMFLVS